MARKLDSILIGETGSSWLSRLFRQISTFFHEVDLVIIMIIFSVYHYTEAMSLRDPAWVVVPFAVGIDLLHFRMTIHLAKNARRWYVWIFPFLLTLAIVTGLQLIYYLEPTEAGDVPVIWKSIVYAAIAPTAITLLAFLREVDLGVEDFRLALRYARELRLVKAALSESEIKAGRAAELEAALKESETKLKEIETALKRHESRMNADEEFGAKLEARLKSAETGRLDAERAARQAEARIDELEAALASSEAVAKKNETANRKNETALSEMKAELDRLRENEKLIRLITPVAKDLLLVHAGLAQDTQAQIAERHQMSTGKVSTVKSYLLNGVSH